MLFKKKNYFIFFAILLMILTCTSQKKTVSKISSLNGKSNEEVKKELVENDNSSKTLKTEEKKTKPSWIKLFIDNVKNSIKLKEKPSVPFFAMSYFQFNDIFFKNIASFHTLVVHFPFFILLLVFIFYTLFLFKKNTIYLKINFYLMLTASLIVVLASFLFFPETENLKKDAEAVLKKHIYFAHSAVIFNLLVTTYFALRLWSKGKLKNYFTKAGVTIVVMLFLAYSLFTVGVTTFYGEILVKKFQVGILDKPFN